MLTIQKTEVKKPKKTAAKKPNKCVYCKKAAAYQCDQCKNADHSDGGWMCCECSREHGHEVDDLFLCGGCFEEHEQWKNTADCRCEECGNCTDTDNNCLHEKPCLCSTALCDYCKIPSRWAIDDLEEWDKAWACPSCYEGIARAVNGLCVHCGGEQEEDDEGDDVCVVRCEGWREFVASK
jgi:hypothetical protein